MVEERGALLGDYLHQAHMAEHLVRFGGARPARDHQLSRLVLLHRPQHCPKGIRLGDSGKVVFRSPGVVRLDSNQLVAHQTLERELPESLLDRSLNGLAIVCDDNFRHALSPSSRVLRVAPTLFRLSVAEDIRAVESS